jgi:uncharacterized membrane protein
MLKKMLSVLLAILLVNLAVIPAIYANDTKAEKEAKFAEKVKIVINKLGVGTDSKVEVKLKDGTKLKGYVSEISDDGFVVTDANGKSTPVPYPSPKQVKGNNLNKHVIYAIGIAAFIVIIAIVAASSK